MTSSILVNIQHFDSLSSVVVKISELATKIDVREPFVEIFWACLSAYHRELLLDFSKKEF